MRPALLLIRIKEYRAFSGKNPCSCAPLLRRGGVVPQFPDEPVAQDQGVEPIRAGRMFYYYCHCDSCVRPYCVARPQYTIGHSRETILRHLVPVSKQPNRIVVDVAPNALVMVLRRRQ